MSKTRIIERCAAYSTDFVRAATLEELKAAGMTVVRMRVKPLPAFGAAPL
jgi:hypothetical protein